MSLLRRRDRTAIKPTDEGRPVRWVQERFNVWRVVWADTESDKK
jgi:hypothetical protein